MEMSNTLVVYLGYFGYAKILPVLRKGEKHACVQRD